MTVSEKNGSDRGPNTYTCPWETVGAWYHYLLLTAGASGPKRREHSAAERKWGAVSPGVWQLWGLWVGPNGLSVHSPPSACHCPGPGMARSLWEAGRGGFASFCLHCLICEMGTIRPASPDGMLDSGAVCVPINLSIYLSIFSNSLTTTSQIPHLFNRQLTLSSDFQNVTPHTLQDQIC